MQADFKSLSSFTISSRRTCNHVWSYDKCKANIASGKTRYLELVDSLCIEPVEEKLTGEPIFNFVMILPPLPGTSITPLEKWKRSQFEQRYTWDVCNGTWKKEEKPAKRKLYYFWVVHYKNTKINFESKAIQKTLKLVVLGDFNATTHCKVSMLFWR